MKRKRFSVDTGPIKIPNACSLEPTCLPMELGEEPNRGGCYELEAIPTEPDETFLQEQHVWYCGEGDKYYHHLFMSPHYQYLILTINGKDCAFMGPGRFKLTLAESVKWLGLCWGAGIDGGASGDGGAGDYFPEWIARVARELRNSAAE